jgi:hypothetical protein
VQARFDQVQAGFNARFDEMEARQRLHMEAHHVCCVVS